MNQNNYTHQNSSASIEEALEALTQKPRHGLQRPINCFARAKKGCIINDQRVDWWITIGNDKVPIRVERLPSRPKRKELRKLLAGRLLPTIFIYNKERLCTLIHKLAKCIRLGINIFRRHRQMVKYLKKLDDMGHRPLPRLEYDCMAGNNAFEGFFA